MPAVTPVRRGKGWCIRFRLPEQIVHRYGFPRQCRLATALGESASPVRIESERRRVEALLDFLVRGESCLNGKSLPRYLGLPQSSPRKSRRPATRVMGMTWPDLVAKYAEDFKANSRARERNFRQRVGRLHRVATALGVGPDEITPKQWTEWLDALDTGSPSKNEYRSVIGCVYKFGITRFVCQTNPVLAVATFRRPRDEAPYYRTQTMIAAELDMRPHTDAEKRSMSRYRVLDLREQAALLELCRNNDPEFLPCVILGLHGVSGIDVRTARHHSYSDGVFTGRRSKTGKASFSVPVAPALRPVLDRHWLKESFGECAFPWVHTVLDTKDKFLHRWEQLIHGTDFGGLGFHALRHSFISLMLSRGVNVEVVGQWVGHLDRNTSGRVYNHFIKTESVSVMASLRLFEAG